MAGIPFLHNIDLNENQLLNAKLHTSGTAPSNPGTGTIWYDSTNDKVKVYDADIGSPAWLTVGKTTEEVQDIVGAMFSSNTETGITATYEDSDGTIDLVVGNATSITIADESSDTTCFPLFATAATGDLAPKTGSNLTFNSSSGLLTATSFSGALTGNVTGDVTGNADTATTATNVTVSANNTTDETTYLTFVDGATGSQGIETDTSLTYNPSTGHLRIEGSGPSIYLDDTDTTTDGSYITGASSAASLGFHADYSNNLNTTKMYFSVDGEEVGHFRGDSSQIGSLRMFPEKNDNAAQGIFFGTAASGSNPGVGTFSDTRVISMSSSEELFLMPGSNTTLATVPMGITSSAITTNVDTINFNSANSTDPLVTIKNTTNDANGARLRFVKDKGAAGADNDYAGQIEFYADDDNQDQVLFAKISAQVSDASNGAEGGKLSLGVATNDGEFQNGIVLTDGNAEDEIDITIGSGSGSVTTVVGDLVVNGSSTTVSSTTVEAGDNMFKFAKDNSANSLDIGWYGKIVSSGTKYAGIWYDASTGISTPKFNVGLATTEPGNTAAIATTGTVVANLEGNVTGNVTGDLTGTADQVANALTVDDTTIQLNSGTTYNGSAARTISAKTAAIADGGTGLATADQIYDHVTSRLSTEQSTNNKSFELDDSASGVASTDNITYTITHGMGASRLYKVEVIEDANNYETVYVEVQRPSDTTIKVIFASAVTAGAYRALVTKI